MTLEPSALNRFLADKFRLDPEDLGLETPLFSSGRLDSFHLIELIGFIEQTSGARVSPGEISLDNLDTPGRILNFAKRKQKL